MSFDAAAFAFKLRQDLKNDMFDDEQPKRVGAVYPIMEDGFAVFGDNVLVGNGEVTNENCGRWSTFKGCLNVEAHNRVTVDGVNHHGKVYVTQVFHTCHKASCPVCYRHGWAVRQGKAIEARLKEASRRFGDVEHMTCSIPVKDYGLKYPYLRQKVTKMLVELGVIGGCLIWHGFRFDEEKLWYFSPHFHVLGFIASGYSRCRHCKGGDCYACGGFDGKTYMLYHKNGYIVAVFGKRKSVYGTAWYQLHHASVKRGTKHFRVATWFGVCSYRRLKVTIEKHKDFCPICSEELVRIRYFGNKWFVKNRLTDGYKRCFEADYEEDGVPVWVECVSDKPKRWRSGGRH